MPANRWIAFALMIALAGCNRSGPAPAKEEKKSAVAAPVIDKVALQPAKIKDLEAAVARQKGNIVVVDLWADYCIPCKVEFPHLVEMSKQHAKDGVVCMSLSIDDLPGSDKGALKFLETQKATIQNFILAEDVTLAQKHWDFKGVPVVLLFDRSGKLHRRFNNDDPDNQFTYADVKKEVAKLLEKK